MKNLQFLAKELLTLIIWSVLVPNLTAQSNFSMGPVYIIGQSPINAQGIQAEVADNMEVILADTSNGMEYTGMIINGQLEIPIQNTSGIDEGFTPSDFQLWASGRFINFNLPKPGNTSLNIYNIRGELVTILLDEKLSSGVYSHQWDGNNRFGVPVATAAYFVRMIHNRRSWAAKLFYDGTGMIGGLPNPNPRRLTTTSAQKSLSKLT